MQDEFGSQEELRHKVKEAAVCEREDKAGSRAATAGLEERGRNGEIKEVKRAGSHCKVNVGTQKRTHKTTKQTHPDRRQPYEGADQRHLDRPTFGRGNLGARGLSAHVFLASQNFLNPFLASQISGFNSYTSQNSDQHMYPFIHYTG